MKTQTILKKPGQKKELATPRPFYQKGMLTSKPQAQSETTDVTMISHPTDEEIASRAYKIWQEQGCPEGFNEAHWRLAEQEIMGMSTEALAS